MGDRGTWEHVTIEDGGGGDGSTATVLNGNLQVDVISGGGGGGSVTITDPIGQDTMANSVAVVIASNQSAVPISAATLPLPTGAATETTLTAIEGALGIIEGLVDELETLVTAAKDAATSVDSTVSGWLKTDDSAFTVGTHHVAPVGYLADESSTDSVDEGDVGAARMTLDRKQIVTTQPHTAGGLLVANFTSGDTYTALTNGAQVIKASAGQIYGWYFHNPNTTTVYILVYNIAAASVTVGTSTAQLVFAVGAGQTANILAANGITFTTAMSAAAATTGGGNTAPTTALEVMFFYV